MRAKWAVLVVAAAVLLGGCGTSDSDQVKAKVRQFGTAVAAHDYRTICGQVLSQSLLDRFAAVGLTCEQAMRTIYLPSVHSPTLAVGRITIQGQKASAITLTGASGQESSLDALNLVSTSQGWRIASLGTPLAPGATTTGTTTTRTTTSRTRATRARTTRARTAGRTRRARRRRTTRTTTSRK